MKEDFVTYKDNKGEYRLWMDKYKVYKNGDIYSLEDKKLQPTISSHGYCTLTPYIDGKRYNKRVHRMVAECWLPNPDKHPMINHINGIKTDNRVENIEWCSASHNIRHAFANGLNKSTTARAVVICETGQVFPSPRKCVEALGWSHLESAITACCRGDGRKTIKGYTFRRYEPTPLVEKLIQAGFNKYPTNYDEETYYIYLCLAQKWLREVKDIIIGIDFDNWHDKYECHVYKRMGYKGELIKDTYGSQLVTNEFHEDFDTYEQSLSAGIDRALEILKIENNEK